jgi:hypothetical protein
MRKFKAISILMGLLCLSLAVTPVFAAELYSFKPVTTAASGDCQTGVDQFKLLVEDFTPYVSFSFINNGPLASVMAEVYFYENNSGLLDFTQFIIDNNFNVTFSNPASPSDLPGIPPAVMTAAFSAGADNPAPINGVGPGEAFGIRILLDGASTYNDVIAALNLGGGYPTFPAGAMLVGVHGTGLASANGGSCSFVTAPIPGSLLLLGSGILGLVGLRRKMQ